MSDRSPTQKETERLIELVRAFGDPDDVANALESLHNRLQVLEPCPAGMWREHLWDDTETTCKQCGVHK